MHHKAIKPYPGTPKENERGADQETPGGEI